MRHGDFLVVQGCPMEGIIVNPLLTGLDASQRGVVEVPVPPIVVSPKGEMHRRQVVLHEVDVMVRDLALLATDQDALVTDKAEILVKSEIDEAQAIVELEAIELLEGGNHLAPFRRSVTPVAP